MLIVFQSPILNHWWQTETGHPITASCVGLECSSNPPRYSVGLPVPGYDGKIYALQRQLKLFITDFCIK